MQAILTLFFTLVLLLPAAVCATDSPTAVGDAEWLLAKGTLIFQDAFEREEDGNGVKAIGNGWQSATADRVPQIKMADLDEGILNDVKIYKVR